MPPTFQATLKAAETLQQRAERRRGAEAAQLHSQAVAKYREALALGGGAPADDIAACLFGLAECLQQGAEATVAACSQLPDESLSADVVHQADTQAAVLLQESVATYQRVLEGGQPRADALVCAGNALCTWAELAAKRDAGQAVQLLQQATDAYRAALQREEDALTWSNLADCMVQRASLLCEAGQATLAGPLFQEAMQAFQHSCSLSDAADGDDVPGLLMNWARGLLAMAQQAQEPPVALQLLDEAARRLQQSIDFLRGSDEPYLALGDVLLERGERLAAGGDSAGAAGALHAALGDGYQQAQRINARSAEASLGVAEVHVQLARLAAAGPVGGQQGGAGVASVAEHWAAAEAAYRAALQQPTAFGFEERCEARYNHACCLARCGRAAEAAALLRALLGVGGVALPDIQQDADVAGVPL